MISVNELLLIYFLGIVIQVLTMTLLISSWLHFILRIVYQLELVLWLLLGIFNIVPYVGPLLAGSLGIVLCIVTSYGSSGYPGLVLFEVAMDGVYVGIYMLVMYLFQPVIFSSSI